MGDLLIHVLAPVAPEDPRARFHSKPVGHDLGGLDLTETQYFLAEGPSRCLGLGLLRGLPRRALGFGEAFGPPA